MSDTIPTLETFLETLLRRIVREEIQSVKIGKAAKTLGISNPVDRVKRLKSFTVFPHCARTVPVGK